MLSHSFLFIHRMGKEKYGVVRRRSSKYYAIDVRSYGFYVIVVLTCATTKSLVLLFCSQIVQDNLPVWITMQPNEQYSKMDLDMYIFAEGVSTTSPVFEECNLAHLLSVV